MQASPIADGIHWVGAIDWNLRDFHGYETPRGATYNAYLVVAEKVALVDTVKTQFVPEMLERIASVVPLDKVDYIVVNHVEPDHNSGLRLAMEAMPQAKVVASPGGVKGVAEYHNGLEIDQVVTGDIIDLGGRTLTFLQQPMVHWPDSMFTYCPEVCTLLCNDAFGQHLATSERFVDEIDEAVWLEELQAYYANILMPLGTQVGKAVEKIKELGWVCHVIAPSHGVAIRGVDLVTLLDRYGKWSTGHTRDKIVVAYSTMWHSTEEIAAHISSAIGSTGTDVYLCDLAVTALSKVTSELLEARGLILGSPTLHHGMLYRNAGYLQYLAGLKPKGKVAGVFGSYGWSSGATKQMTERLEAIGFEMPHPDFTWKYRATAEDFATAETWAVQFAEWSKQQG